MLIPFPSSATLTRFDVCGQDGVLPGMFCMCLCVLCVLCVCVRARARACVFVIWCGNLGSVVRV